MIRSFSSAASPAPVGFMFPPTAARSPGPPSGPARPAPRSPAPETRRPPHPRDRDPGGGALSYTPRRPAGSAAASSHARPPPASQNGRSGLSSPPRRRASPPPRGQELPLENIPQLNDGDLHDPYGHRQGLVHDLLVEPFAPLFTQQLGIGHPGNRSAIPQNHRRRHHRPGQRSSPRLIYPCEPAKSPPADRPLDSPHPSPPL